jgi:hypothetical protein
MEKNKYKYGFNFWNPLTLVVIILALIASPFIAMFVNESVATFYSETFEILKKGMKSKPKKNLLKFKIITERS